MFQAILLLFAFNLSATGFSADALPSATVIPAIHGTALDGHTVALPQDLSHATVLILGFSRNSAGTTTAWEKPVRSNLATNPAIGFFDMPMLADAPSFIRPLIVHSIRKQVPDALKPHFVPLTEDEADWKQIARFTPAAPDAAYVLLVDRTGVVRWQTHEPFTPAAFQQLSEQTRKLAEESH